MTRKYEAEIITTQRSKLVAVTCDRCGATIKDAGSYDIRDFTLEFTEGESYSEGGYKSGWQVEDLCDECIQWLRTLLLGHDIIINDLEIDW